jgi:hypothetical protein
MDSRSRIRWQKVANLALGVAGSVALFLVLPTLIRRPEPPPLEPDIGLASVTASREPPPSERRPASRPRHRTGQGPREAGDRPRRGLLGPVQGGEPEGRKLVGDPHARRRGVLPPADSLDTAVAPLAPGPVTPPAPAAAVTAPPTPAPDLPAARARVARPPAASEFGFER